MRKILGAVLLLCGSLFFFVCTVDMCADVRIAGPINMWPPPVWIYLIIDIIFVLLAFAGMRVMGLNRLAAGSVATVVAAFTLIFIVVIHLNAPQRDGISHGRYAPADVESYVAAYVIAGSVLSIGLWLIIRHARRQTIS
ncbi:MAG TPA: hypothetical protein VF074_17445 [Pyrinomonadaceae bacterium]